jgi:hypothetical protein
MRRHVIWSGFCLLLAACASARTPASISIRDLPDRNVIRINNESHDRLEIYYNYVSDFGNLQMFLFRFRDRNGNIIPITDAPGRWFTPQMRYADFHWPPRRRLVVPAGGSLEFERSIASAVSWASWHRPVEGPCEVQVKLFGYLGPHTTRSVEIASDWHRGPCPE